MQYIVDKAYWQTFLVHTMYVWFCLLYLNIVYSVWVVLWLEIHTLNSPIDPNEWLMLKSELCTLISTLNRALCAYCMCYSWNGYTTFSVTSLPPFPPNAFLQQTHHTFWIVPLSTPYSDYNPAQHINPVLLSSLIPLSTCSLSHSLSLPFLHSLSVTLFSLTLPLFLSHSNTPSPSLLCSPCWFSQLCITFTFRASPRPPLPQIPPVAFIIHYWPIHHGAWKGSADRAGRGLANIPRNVVLQSNL